MPCRGDAAHADSVRRAGDGVRVPLLRHPRAAERCLRAGRGGGGRADPGRCSRSRVSRGCGRVGEMCATELLLGPGQADAGARDRAVRERHEPGGWAGAGAGRRCAQSAFAPTRRDGAARAWRSGRGSGSQRPLTCAGASAWPATRTSAAAPGRLRLSAGRRCAPPAGLAPPAGGYPLGLTPPVASAPPVRGRAAAGAPEDDGALGVDGAGVRRRRRLFDAGRAGPFATPATAAAPAGAAVLSRGRSLGFAAAATATTTGAAEAPGAARLLRRAGGFRLAAARTLP